MKTKNNIIYSLFTLIGSILIFAQSASASLSFTCQINEYQRKPNCSNEIEKHYVDLKIPDGRNNEEIRISSKLKENINFEIQAISKPDFIFVRIVENINSSHRKTSMNMREYSKSDESIYLQISEILPHEQGACNSFMFEIYCLSQENGSIEALSTRRKIEEFLSRTQD